jgi:hypothetical protein
MESTTHTQSHPYYCYCGCGGTVQVTFPNGFAGTTAIITPCPQAPSYIAAIEVRKSAVLEMTPANQGCTVRHINGLVTMDVK